MIIYLTTGVRQQPEPEIIEVTSVSLADASRVEASLSQTFETVYTVTFVARET